MKIFYEGIEWTKIPTTRKKPGSFADRLVGINFAKNKDRILVEPIYQAVVKIERQGGITFVILSWEEPFLVVILMPSWPFVNFVRPDGYPLED